MELIWERRYSAFRTFKIFEIHNGKVEKYRFLCSSYPQSGKFWKTPTFHDFTVAYPIENHGHSLKCHDFPDFAGFTTFSGRLLHKNRYFFYFSIMDFKNFGCSGKLNIPSLIWALIFSNILHKKRPPQKNVYFSKKVRLHIDIESELRWLG